MVKTQTKKCKHVEEAERTNNIRGTILNYKRYTLDIRHRRTNYE